jgi:hypothetical protein
MITWFPDHEAAVPPPVAHNAEDWTSSMARAEFWLEHCMNYHSECISTKDAQFHPTRLLSIGDSNSQNVFLEIGLDKSTSRTQYATLSHCWGTSKALRLTSATQLRLQAGIPTTELARTFRDAIFVARHLGIKLLWIDSLCILQDSSADWERESSQMSQVYRHATINIAATVAPDSDAGCLPNRSEKTLEHEHVVTDWSDHSNHHFLIEGPDVWTNTLRHLPLMQRAWVVQELLLAPRVLHFCRREMLWECYGIGASEKYPYGLPEIPEPVPRGWTREQKSRVFGSKQALTSQLVRSDDQDTAVRNNEEAHKSKGEQRRNELLQLWRVSVHAYTRCSLTYSSDKLVALSGVAKLMQQALGDEYCAGLWRSRLFAELAWFRDRGNHNAHEYSSFKSTFIKTVPYRAPSWSWACYDGPVSCSDLDGVELPNEVIHCDIKNTTLDRTGAIASAELKLCCRLATVTLRLIKRDTNIGWSLFYNGEWLAYEKTRIVAHVMLDYPTRVISVQAHCVPLQMVRQTGVYAAAETLYCLLLAPTGVKKGQFRRPGLLSVGYYQGQSRVGDWRVTDGVVNEEWMEYESARGDGRYVISII